LGSLFNFAEREEKVVYWRRDSFDIVTDLLVMLEASKIKYQTRATLLAEPAVHRRAVK
jgi:hypothetical protein